MKFTDLTVLLPCHSLEDFPTYYEGPQADELLAAWCALWHPALIAGARTTPDWHRVDVPPETLAGRLVALPPFCADRLPVGFADRLNAEGGWLVRQSTRDAAVVAALAGLDEGAAPVDAELVADFAALGFCRLQIELLTRQMRYSLHVDEALFREQSIAAAVAAMAGEVESARGHLQQCFDALNECRKHFYPVDAYLIDVTLLADSTLGASLTRELQSASPKNLLASAALVSQVSTQHPDTWSQLLGAIDRSELCVLGNEVDESPLPLLPLEGGLASLAAGAGQYEQHLGRRPRVYARRTFGLWTTLPQMLTKLGYQGALHFTLDDGRFPLGPQCKTRWQGLDSSALDVLSRVPSDASRPESLLGYSRKMADSMDSDHVATLIFAHWPGQACSWYDDLRRVARWSPVLGKFALADEYFSSTDMPGRISQFEPDEYRTPYLKQAVIRGQADPISCHVAAHRRQAASTALQAVSTLAGMASGSMPSDAGPPVEATPEAIAAAVERFAAALPRRGDAAPRTLIVNPLSFSRSIGLELLDDDKTQSVVEVPTMGFACIDRSTTPKSPGRAKPIARDNVLANEFFEMALGRTTGGIASIHTVGHRGNLLSQQVAFRLPDPPAASAEGTYATMRCESLDVARASTALGEIVTRGSIIDSDGKRWAGFRQTTTVWAGSRTIRLAIELLDVEEPRADPWNSYCAARFAWPDETAMLWRGVGLTRQATDATRFEAPEYIDVENASRRVSILTGGLPYHRRTGTRMLDSLLVVRGETARRFELAIGVDLAQPAAAALELITPPTRIDGIWPAPASASGWFFHLDSKNIVATHWQPLVDDGNAPNDAAPRPVRGFRVRLLETAGWSGRVALRAFRRVAAARQLDFAGEPMLELPVEDDKILLDFAQHEWIEVEARFEA